MIYLYLFGTCFHFIYVFMIIGNIYQAIESDNCVISTVAQIISRTSEGATERELWKEINDYLKRNV